MLTFKKLGDGAFHITSENAKGGMLTRYGFLGSSLKQSYSKASVLINGNTVTLQGAKRNLAVTVTEINGGGYRLDIPLTEKERLFGVGDATRDGVMLRGKTIGIWVSNVISYGPIPLILSSDGWALSVNSTYKQKFDIGDTNKYMLSVYVCEDTPDFCLFSADSLKETLMAVTDIIGKPTMLPSFAYGLTFVENERLTGAKELLDDIKRMRDEKIPCDIIGLEPSWMETHYDFTVNKRWNPERFPLNSWNPPNQAHSSTFFAPIRFMGMQLSLWLCEDYDLFYEEERNASRHTADSLEEASDSERDAEEFKKNAEFLDGHLAAKVMDSKSTVPEEPWFEHLKKFVDNGAACFKLDGSNQVLEHPQRAWAEKFFDREVHNIYPLVLARQMYQGYREHTGRRAMVYSAGAYTGIQKYAATWAGDTGGGQRTLVSCMNYAMCGHTNTSCDMSVHGAASVHYGFLQSWSQINSWASHYLPWYLLEEDKERIKRYSELRSSLFPYIYSTAHNASVTGIPILRPLPLVYEDTDRFDSVTNAYMLGDSLYVGAFDMSLSLPDGKWVDYFTGKVYSGNISYEIPKGYGGALFAKAGSVIGTMTPQLYINEREHDYIIRVFPGGDAEFSLYEDDGYSYGYENGEFAQTLFELKDNGEEGCSLTVYPREGSFPGRPDNGHNIYNNSVPEVKGILPVSDMKIFIHKENVKSITLAGEKIPFVLEDGICKFTLDAKRHAEGTLTFDIVYK